MKNGNHFIAGLVIMILSVTACSKSEPSNSWGSPPPAPPVFPPPGSVPPAPVTYPRTLKATVLEYGTNIPLSNVQAVLVGNREDTQYTDLSGICFFQQTPSNLKSFIKINYWPFEINYQAPYFTPTISPVQLYPATPYTYPVMAFSCDSFTIKLFHQQQVTVRLQDLLQLSTCTDCNVILAVNGIFTDSGNDYTVFSGGSFNQNGPVIRLRKGIDTTFSVTTFGNTKNIFTIGEDDAGNGWPGFLTIFKKDTVQISPTTSSLHITF